MSKVTFYLRAPHPCHLRFGSKLIDGGLRGSLGVAKICNQPVSKNTKMLLSVLLSPTGRLGDLALRALSGSIIVKVVKVALRGWGCRPCYVG